MPSGRARSRQEWGLGITDQTVLEIFLLFEVPARGRLALEIFQRCWRHYHLQDAELVLSIERLEGTPRLDRARGRGLGPGSDAD